VTFVAGDTFRAAAIEQLQVWGERVGAEVVKQKQGSDPSAVVFDGLASALAKRTDVVLIDTAGRLHTKTNLMEELEKTHRVIQRKLPGAPHEVWLVLDATTGQNAISQAEMFHKALGLTGMILTKLDGTAKGGIVVGICHQLKIPIRFIGIGEKMDDLRPFNAPDFVDAIFG
jgi:fused signal recognition particle receptor